MKKFSLEEYLAHQEKKVVRRDGKAARIVCTDFQRSNGVFDIIVCFFVDKERELAYSVNTEGRRYENEETEDDIFFADDEKQLSEFEKALEVFLMNADSSEETFHEEVKKHAAELFALAREQIIKDGYVIEKKAFHEAVEKVAPEVMKEVSENVDKTNEELTEFERELESFYNHHLQVCTYDNQGTVEDSLHDGASKLLALAKKELCEQIVDNTKEAYENGKAEALKDLPRWKTIKKDDNANVRIPHVGTNIVGEMMLYIGENAISISRLTKLPGFKEDE